jgi:hypothetical protein
MTLRIPPRMATWLLKHLGPGYRLESLAGDLFEEYQLDRSRAWYWRQTAAAVLSGGTRRLRLTVTKFVLTAVLRVLIELGIIVGGIALAESKALCPAPLRACHYNSHYNTSQLSTSPPPEQTR